MFGELAVGLGVRCFRETQTVIDIRNHLKTIDRERERESVCVYHNPIRGGGKNIS